MLPKEVKEARNPEEDLSKLLILLHQDGAKDPHLLECFSYFKEFHPSVFQEFEERILSALGLFYKIQEPNNLYSFLMSRLGEHDKGIYGTDLTPVQASIRRAVDKYQYTSISAPTSAGKSYSIREFIAQDKGDAVIIVPSRALIAEYMNAMRRLFDGQKDVMVTPFADLVYTSRKLRRIFILTPERSKDLYKIRSQLNVKAFFMDEAQVSEDQKRGIVFDLTVRRIQKNFPTAKIIFAHPFVENPEAQFSKHAIQRSQSYAQSYPYAAVGKVCIFKHDNNNCYYFSPYSEGGHHIKNCVSFEGSFQSFALSREHTILIYVSKSSIYRGSFLDEFKTYIKDLPYIEDKSALQIIDRIKHVVGADSSQHRSAMVELLQRGVVIHHGSIPLEVRFLVEDFIREGYALLCFATSTLAQGINMPFDIVWLDNNRFDGTEDERALAFKNLIGRSGRLSKEKKFDYGYVYTTKPLKFSERIQSSFRLEEGSILDNPNISDEDTKEIIASVQNDTFDEDKNIPLAKVERLAQDFVLESATKFLQILYSDSKKIKDNLGGPDNEPRREQAKEHLKIIYEASLGRALKPGELAVFSNAVSIFFHIAQGRSFREIVGIRYSYITDRDNSSKKYAKFLQPAETLPDISLDKVYSIYPQETLVNKVSYDAIVFDTYDYLDKVLSFSLSDTFIAAFKIYYDRSSDERASQAIELFRYGTNNQKHILLMRYGFPPETVGDLAPYVERIDEKEIRFTGAIDSAPRAIKHLIEWYLPQ